MHPGPHPYISLTEAADVTPGRPTSSCLWRWCRSGVLARNRVRIYLRHIRIGGKIFTNHAWLREFSERLAAADAEYFQKPKQEPGQASVPLPRKTKSRTELEREAAIARAERSLREAGV